MKHKTQNINKQHKTNNIKLTKTNEKITEPQ